MRGEAAYLRTDVLGYDELPAGAAPVVPSGGVVRVVTPQTLLDAKHALSGPFEQTRRDVQGCAALSANEQSAFAELYQSWRAFFCRNDTGQCAAPDYGWWGLGSQLDQVDSYQQRLFDWQSRVQAARCTLSAPELPPPPPPPDVGGALKWGVALVAGVLLIVVVSQTGVPHIWRKPK
jgi:hypothetical protein